VVKSTLATVMLQVLLCDCALAGITFQVSPLKVSGLPDGFVANCWTMADVEGGGIADVIVAGNWWTDRASRSAAFVLRAADGMLSVRHTLLERVASASPEEPNGIYAPVIQSLSHCDLDNDGREEVFAIGSDPSEQRMTQWRDGAWVEGPLPFPGLAFPVIAWLDFDGDGWIDLVLVGGEPIAGREREVVGVVGRLWRNEHGKLQPTDITFDVREYVDSAHVIDFDQDGKPDLLLGVDTSWNTQRACNRLFLNRPPGFEEVEFPLEALDKLEGLSRMHVSSADFDGDGLVELLVAGSWHNRIGPKGYLSLIYRKKRWPEGNRYTLSYDYSLTDELPDILGPFVVTDLDADGDPDVFASGSGRDGRAKIVCLENKEGHLQRVVDGPWRGNAEQPLGEEYGNMVVPVDVNHDGLTDFVCFPSVSGKGIVLLSNGSRKMGERKAAGCGSGGSGLPQAGRMPGSSLTFGAQTEPTMRLLAMVLGLIAFLVPQLWKINALRMKGGFSLRNIVISLALVLLALV
jgi:hypothetical protein